VVANGEHFATWCATGRPRSWQVEAVSRGVAAVKTSAFSMSRSPLTTMAKVRVPAPKKALRGVPWHGSIESGGLVA